MLRILLLFLALLAALPARAGVVSAADPRAAEAGRTILREGGSAADAEMAMMLALTVVEPQSSGIGGGGFFVHHEGKSGAVATIDGRETAPAAAGPGRFLGADGRPMPFIQAFPGGLSVGVPGNMRLMARVHQRWGRLPWAKLFEPAIALAENGFTVTKRLHDSVALVSPLWKDFPQIAALYAPGGQPPVVGTTLRNPALAVTLRAIRDGGPDAFYAGAIGRGIGDTLAHSARHPSPLTLADLAAYKAKDRPAICGRYRSYRICGMGPPSSGAITILQMLAMLERFDMKKLGMDSPVAWHLIGEAMQLAYADREKYLGDCDFLSVPIAGLLGKAYLANRSALISQARAIGEYLPGTPSGAPKRTAAISGEVPATTNFVAADDQGDVATMTSTVEGPFGSQLVSGGMVLNNELTDFTFAPEKDGAPVANRVEAGKRPLSSMSPTIVYGQDGKVLLALGSAGGKRIIMHVAKTLIAFLDWDEPIEGAIAEPNLYFGGGALLTEQGTKLDAMRGAIQALGQTVTPADLTSKVNAIQRQGKGWHGAADPRSEGVALVQ